MQTYGSFVIFAVVLVVVPGPDFAVVTKNALRLGQLAGEQTHWYDRVLRSSGLEPPTEIVPDLAEFLPGMRAHVADCLDIYWTLLADPEMLR